MNDAERIAYVDELLSIDAARDPGALLRRRAERLGKPLPADDPSRGDRVDWARVFAAGDRAEPVAGPPPRYVLWPFYVGAAVFLVLVARELIRVLGA